MIKFFAFLVVFFLLVGVGSVCVGQLVSDTSIISLSGRDWSLKVDGGLQSFLDSRNVPYMTSKSVSEKELFLELESFEDCKSGVVQFKVDMQGLTAYKQLPLNLELEAKEYEFVNSTHAINNSQVVVYRPENIVNSFALFDDSGRKQVHISASKLVDASGEIMWCDSNLEGGLLTVVFPLEWLEFAKFPVVLDPTFGTTSVGGTLWTGDNTYAIRNNYTVANNITINKFSVWCGDLSGNISIGIYNGTDAIWRDVLDVSSGLSWQNKTVPNLYFSSGTYYLALKKLVNDTGIYFDNGGYYDRKTLGATDILPISFMNDFTGTRMYSMFVVYEVYVEPTPTPTPSPSPSSTLTPITSGELNNSMLFVLGFIVVMCVVGLVWLSRVPILVLLVGFFAVLIGLYCVLGGVYGLGVGQGWFALFTVVFGGLTMLLVGLGVRVRR